MVLAQVSLLCRANGDQAIASENPYKDIASHNIFKLVPEPVNDSSDGRIAEPLPQIMPDGLTSISGKWQVLFKVNAPSREKSYILSVGESQDNIGVVAIDYDAGLVTFNNHGTIQSLHLADFVEKDQPAHIGASFPVPRHNFIRYGDRARDTY